MFSTTCCYLRCKVPDPGYYWPNSDQILIGKIKINKCNNFFRYKVFSDMFLLKSRCKVSDPGWYWPKSDPTFIRKMKINKKKILFFVSVVMKIFFNRFYIMFSTSCFYWTLDAKFRIRVDFDRTQFRPQKNKNKKKFLLFFVSVVKKVYISDYKFYRMLSAKIYFSLVWLWIKWKQPQV